MKTTTIAAALALSFAATGAFASAGAGEATYEFPLPAVSENSRAEVRAELLQSQQVAAHVTEASGQDWTPVLAARSRTDVRAEAAAALASGEIRARASEAGGFDGGIRPATARLLLAAR